MKPGFKQTEIGAIPEDWSVSPLGHNLRRPPAYGINAPATLYDSDHPTYLRITDITEDCRYSEASKVSVKHPQANSYLLEQGDIVFARTGASVGKSYLYRPSDGPLVFAGFLIRLSPNKSTLIPGFLAYYAQSRTYNTWVQLNSTRTGQPGINGREYGTLPVPLPPTLAEQEAIASALGDADALIESLERLIAKKRDVKQGAMQELLTARRRLPGFKGKWETKTLGQLATIQRGASPRPIDSPIWFDVNSTVGWVRISDVAPLGMYLHATSQKLSELGIRHSRPVDEGSLIMSICATVGRPVITAIDTCIHDGFVVFDRLQVDIRFLYYLLKSLEDTWSKHGQTGSQMNLNTTLINGTAVILPTTQEEQTAIATVLSDMDSELAALEAKLSKARAIKQGMMQELLTGRIRLK